MLTREWPLTILFVGVMTITIAAVSQQNNEGSLKDALEAVSRKQRSLDSNTLDYFNDLRSLKYHGGSGDRKFDRNHQSGREIEGMDEGLEFLPNGGQVETVGNGYQDLDNKLLERALIDYLESIPKQDEPVTSLFRERERNYNRKRGNPFEPLNVDNKELAKLFLGEIQDGPSYNLGELGDNSRYMDAHQMLYDRYRPNRTNKLYDNSGPMSWGELLNREGMSVAQGSDVEENEYSDREQDPNVLYLTMGNRENLNGEYPIGRSMRINRNMAKRYPIAKRSPKPMPIKKQVTDPKVAQDLGTLFGTQYTDGQNRTHEHDHDRSQEHNHGDQSKHESSSETPKVISVVNESKENTTNMTSGKSIEVRKKSVDWSQYFGIDRRRKKASFMPGLGTQNQDNEWMLQRYYENMVENLKGNDRDNDRAASEKKQKLEHWDSKRKNIKDLIIEEALQSADSEDGADLQKVKDKVMARMAAAYSLEKMRKALNDLKSNVAARIEAQKLAQAQANHTSNFRQNINAPNSKDKRTQNNIIEPEAMEEIGVCPELEAIEKRCKTADNLVGDESQMLYLPCVMLQICKACVQDDLEEECLGNYAVEAGKICDAQEIKEGQKSREACASAALILSQLQPSTAVFMQCRLDGNDSCLRRYHYQYWHRYLRYPYSRRQPTNGYDLANNPQQSHR